MMEEVSIVVAYDAHVFGQLRDEDLLANLVAVSKPKAVATDVVFDNAGSLMRPRRDPECH